VKRYWTESWYDQPVPFYSGQAPGRLFIELAPTVPLRTNSPFNRGVQTNMRDVLLSLRAYAEANQVSDAEALLPEARRLIGEVEALVTKQMARNVFSREAAP
jgi:arabinosaccharide transport system substrate-binding protein